MGGLRILLPSDNGIEIPTSSGSDAGVKHQTQGWARTAQVAMPAKNMPGRKAGEDHARSQGCLRQEARPTS